MAKRFIDTGLFDDSWFMNLSKDAKILWVYLITKCDHAGIIEVNDILIKVQTGIKGFLTVKEELGNRLIFVRDNYYFIPKFIDFQYPNFPNSNVRQQESAIKILIAFGIFNVDTDKIEVENLTVSKVLPKPYDSDTVNVYVYNKFYDEQLKITTNPKYEAFVKFLFGENDFKKPLTGVLSIRDQISSDDFEKLLMTAKTYNKTIKEAVSGLENKTAYHKGKVSFYITVNNWLKNEKYN